VIRAIVSFRVVVSRVLLIASYTALGEWGEARLDNLVTLCRFYHRELDRGHFFLTVKSTAIKAFGESDYSNRVRFSERLSFLAAGWVLMVSLLMKLRRL
jgi:hypothetical protein